MNGPTPISYTVYPQRKPSTHMQEAKRGKKTPDGRPTASYRAERREIAKQIYRAIKISEAAARREAAKALEATP